MDSYLRSALHSIEEVTGRLDADAIAPPAEGRWSIADIFEHLTLAFTANAATLEKMLVSGESRARAPRLKERLARILVVDIGYFPRADAPEMTRPRGSIPPGQSVTAIRQAITDLDATLTRVAARFGDGVRVANHPYFAGLSVLQWRKFHWRHTVHHMRQVRARLRLSSSSRSKASD
jgi:uncharacterized protein DUF1569